MNSNSKWIWVDNAPAVDTYGEFYSSFDYEGGQVQMNISADSNYVLFLNGKFVESDQYPDFPYDKVYDTFDITKHCQKGKNHLAILVWYYGESNFSYYPGKAALRFDVTCDGKLLLASDEKILSRYSHAYENGLKKVITGQLGFGFRYDATREDNWQMGELDGFSDSVTVDQDLPLRARGIKKLNVLPRIDAPCIKSEGNRYLFDLGFEEVGYLTLKVKSNVKQNLIISYGEHILDGWVRRLIKGRDFSVEVTVGEGTTEYTNYLRRFGLRYLEVESEGEIEIEYASVLPTVYPLNKLPKHFDNEVHQKIYDISARTLELCMHDHYEDCPWREQGLYAMDSRNQMLCGYYAFEEFTFPRDNLYLFSKDNREDGILSICTPTLRNLTIPSFSLHYIMAVNEYTQHSGDLTLVREVMPKLQKIISVFEGQIENGVIKNLIGEPYWNFYEWSEGLNGYGGDKNNIILDTPVNCLFSMALAAMVELCGKIGLPTKHYEELIPVINQGIRETFFDAEKGLYINNTYRRGYSELTNSLAVLCGAAVGDEAESIRKILASDNDLTKISLSMLCFKFDALIAADKEKYRDYIIKTIEEKYVPMLEFGATSFWETERGANDFGSAASLCHGWSALPIYYFHLLGL